MDLRELCFHLRHRRRMYLPDDRYGTAVAFVEGYNSALGAVPLSGFQEYVATRTGNAGSPVHWSYLIASTAVPDIFDEGAGIGQVPVESGISLTDTLVDLLEAYQADVSAN
ncbi:hypothetical protein [Lentzea californiensis]|uniref:hypothetical protein n=1 Tax=Lentzea californiensis TaxID=438851 RepID=UPI002165170C|nr:hypothetical protein [Lentzea californiensis]MCR3751468.1 hypothetical protein [Lentzea californiensis]